MKVKIIIILLLITSLLCACTHSSNDKYTIFYKGGKCYIRFPEETTAEEETQNNLNGFSGCVAIEYPTFNSVSEMQEKILSGDISAEGLYALRTCSEDSVLEICDPSALCNLTLPEDMVCDFVTWHGNYYYFNLTCDWAEGYAECVNEEYYNREFSYQYLNYPDPEFHTVNSDTTISERNARLVDSSTSQVNFKTLLYELPTASGNTLYVQEKFLLRWFNDPTGETSETIPYQISFFGNWNGNYFYGWLHEFKERPSVEWLSSFGLAPLEANPAS